MKKILAVLVASMFAAGAFAQAAGKAGADTKMPEAQKSGSEAPKAKAEMKADAKMKGGGAPTATSAANPMPQEAQKAGSEKAQAKAEMKADAKGKGMAGNAESKAGADKKMPEAQKPGSEKAEAKAQAKTDAKKP